eukprot:scaffold767_cov163-Pinguiococcus_pyrenoidosus.AAC.1
MQLELLQVRDLLGTRIPKDDEDRTRRVHGLPPKVVEQQLKSRVSRLRPPEHVDAVRLTRVLWKSSVDQLLHEAGLPGISRTRDHDLGDRQPLASFLTANAEIARDVSGGNSRRNGTSHDHLKPRPQKVQDITIGFICEFARQPHIHQILAEVDAIDFLQAKRRDGKATDQGLGSFVSNAVVVEAEAGELRDVGQSLRRQGHRAFGSNAVVAEVEVGELCDVGQSVRRQGRRAFGSNAVVVEVQAGELRDVGQSLRRQGFGAFISNAVAVDVEAGELRDVGQSFQRQGLGAFGSNAVAVEVDAGELRDVGQSLRCQGFGAFFSNAVAVEVEAGELRDVGQSLRRQGFGAFGSNAVVVEVEAGELRDVGQSLRRQ